jgi:DNA-directed RNA polymerase subunit RPC12/RpoP
LDRVEEERLEKATNQTRSIGYRLGTIARKIGWAHIKSGDPMKTFLLVCDRCHAEVVVEPEETMAHRSVNCKTCGAELVFHNEELKVRDVPDGQIKERKSLR